MNEYTRITVPLSKEEFCKLKQVAIQQYRHPRDQARYLLRLVLSGETVQENSKTASVMNVSEANTTSGFASVNP